MKKLLLVFLIIIYFSIWSHGQIMTKKATIEFGKPFDTKSVNYSPKMFGHNSEGYFFRYIGKSEYDKKTYFLSLDNSLGFSLCGETKLLINDKSLDVESYIQTRTNTFILSNKKDSKNDQINCYFQVFDKTANAGKGDLALVGTVSYKNALASEVSMYFRTSPDSSKVVADLAPARLRTDSVRRIIIVFDSEMKRLWERKLSFPHQDTSYYVRDVIVDNNGNAFVLYIKRIKDIDTKKNDAYEYGIMYIGRNGKTVADKIIYNGKESLDKVKIIFLENGNISCSGLFTDPVSNWYIGMYNILVDPASLEVKKSSFTKWDVNVMKAYESKNWVNNVQKEISKGKNVTLSDCYLSNPVKTDDGGLYIILEETGDKTVTEKSPISSGSTQSTMYFYNSIILGRVSADGEVIWMKKIPKKQISSVGNISAPKALNVCSFFPFTKGNNLYLLYNDVLENKNIKENIEPEYSISNVSKTFLMLASVSDNGVVVKEPLHLTSKNKLWASPVTASSDKDGSVIMFFYNGGDVAAAKIKVVE